MLYGLDHSDKCAKDATLLTVGQHETKLENDEDIMFKVAIVGCDATAVAHVKALSLNHMVSKIHLHDLSTEKPSSTQYLSEKIDYFEELERLILASDAAILCAPNGAHYAMISKLLAIKQLPILCEKPLASTWKEAEYIKEVSSIYSTIGFNYRYHPVIRFIKEELLAENPAEMVQFIDMSFYKDGALSQKDLTWKDSKEKSVPGNSFGDFSVHLINLAEFITDQVILEDQNRLFDETRVLHKSAKKVSTSNNSSLTGLTKDGVAFRIKTSKPAEKSFGLTISVKTNRRELIYRTDQPRQIGVVDSNSSVNRIMSIELDEIIPSPLQEFTYWSDTFYHQSVDWLSAIKQADPSKLVSLDQALHTQRLMDMSFNRIKRERLSHVTSIASDVDGTLLNSSSTFSQKTINGIKRVISKGIPFIFATGRHHTDIGALREEIDVNAYIIAINGAVILDLNGNILKELTLSEDNITKLRGLETAKDVIINVYQGNRWLFTKHEDWIVEEHARVGSQFQPELFNWEEFVPESVLKYFFTADQDTLLTIQEEIYSKMRGEVNIFHTCPTMLEVVSKHASKPAAIRYILSSLGKDMKDCLAFGDGMNDYEMLSQAGYGVIMGNANPRLNVLLPYCEVIGTNNDDSVAHFLEDWIDHRQAGRLFIRPGMY